MLKIQTIESVTVAVQTADFPGNETIIIILPWKVTVALLKELTLVGCVVFTLGIERSALEIQGLGSRMKVLERGGWK